VDVVVSKGGGFPSPPYRKVVLLGDVVEVADVVCEDWGEPVVRHADLESQLRARHPGLATDSEWTAGWLTHSGDEAVVCLHVGAGGLSTEDADRVRRALHDWCSAAGVRRLTIRDTSRGDDSPELSEEVSHSDWSLP